MERTNKKLNPHMVSGRHETAPHWWEESVLTTRHPLSPHLQHEDYSQRIQCYMYSEPLLWAIKWLVKTCYWGSVLLNVGRRVTYYQGVFRHQPLGPLISLRSWMSGGRGGRGRGVTEFITRIHPRNKIRPSRLIESREKITSPDRQRGNITFVA